MAPDRGTSTVRDTRDSGVQRAVRPVPGKGIVMPWFPDFASAVELARRQTRAAGQADPVTQYFEVLNSGDPRSLEDVWPGKVTVHDPLAGQVSGHRELRRY